MADEYQLLADPAAFQASLRDLNLAEAEALTWTESRVDGSKARLKGLLERPGRPADSLEVTMIKKDRRWRVLRFESSAAAGRETSGGPAARDNEEMAGLARRHLQALGRSLESDDFSAFHQLAAALWRAQVSPAELKSAYAPLKPHARLLLDLAATGDVAVTAITPGAQAGGIPVVNLTGQVTGNSRRLLFTLKLISEKDKWLMIGLETALY